MRLRFGVGTASTALFEDMAMLAEDIVRFLKQEVSRFGKSLEVLKSGWCVCEREKVKVKINLPYIQKLRMNSCSL